MSAARFNSNALVYFLKKIKRIKCNLIGLAEDKPENLKYSTECLKSSPLNMMCIYYVSTRINTTIVAH